METAKRIKIDSQNSLANFQENFNFPVSLFCSGNKKNFIEKIGKIGVYTVAPSNKTKVVGECLIDFANISNIKNIKIPLQKCPDSQGNIEIEIKLAQLDNNESNKVESANTTEDTVANQEIEFLTKTIQPNNFRESHKKTGSTIESGRTVDNRKILNTERENDYSDIKKMNKDPMKSARVPLKKLKENLNYAQGRVTLKYLKYY